MWSVLLGGMLTLLGGALGAGYTAVLQRRQFEREKAAEQATWHRNQRSATYDLLSRHAVRLRSVALAPASAAVEAPTITEPERAEMFARLELFASLDIRNLLDELLRNFVRYMNARDDMRRWHDSSTSLTEPEVEDRDADYEELIEQRVVLIAACDRVLELMRLDLAAPAN